MRRLCLFVHTPVTPSLGLGINSIAIGDLFTPHALKLDEELFPLLLEAKPCVILASISDNETSASVYNLMREFKEFRMRNGSAARDPGLRIVVVSEGQIPRLNWASLGIYELIIGPVQANVLTYKLNRHYHKAIDAGDPEPDLAPANLVKDVEMKAEASSTPEWKTFTSSPLEKLQTRVFKKTETEVKEISLRVAIPGLVPAAGKWKKSEIQRDPPPEWNWEYTQETPEGPTHWSFRGEEPVYHPEDGTWQFISTLPKLLSFGRNSTGTPDVKFEYLPKTNSEGEGRLDVKSDLQVKSIRTQTYREANPESDPLIVDDSGKVEADEISPDEIAEAMAELETAILQKKQNFGEAPREREASKGPGWGEAPEEREEDPFPTTSDARQSKREKPKPNYGKPPRDREPAEESDEAIEKKKRSARDGLSPSYPPLRENQADSEAPPTSKPEKSGGVEKNQNPFPLMGADRSIHEKKGTPVPAREETSDPKTTPAAIANQESHNAAAKPVASVPPVMQNPYSKSRATDQGYSEEVPNLASASFPIQEGRNPHDQQKRGTIAEPEINFASNPKMNEEVPAGVGAKLKHAANEMLSEAPGKKFNSEIAAGEKSTHIRADETSGSMSALYDDDEKAKPKANRKGPSDESTEIELFAEHVWKFRLVKRAHLANPSRPGSLGQKVSLAPQQKLSLEERRSLVDRILRYIVEFFTRAPNQE